MKKINVIVSEVLAGGTMISNYKAVIGDYKDYYKLGGFDIFDVVRVEWKGYEVSIFLDDEGLMKSGNYGRNVEAYPEPLFGNFILTGGTDSKG